MKINSLDVPKESNQIYLYLQQNGSLGIQTTDNASNEDILCANAEFNNSIMDIGYVSNVKRSFNKGDYRWNKLYVKTTGECGRLGSIFAAGWVEGYLTSQSVFDYYHNLKAIYGNLRKMYSDLFGFLRC